MGKRRFFGGVSGSARTAATRLGTAYSGLTAFAQGWNSGVRVETRVTAEDHDEFMIYANGGSNSTGANGCAGGAKIHIATISNGRITLIHSADNRHVDERSN